MLLRFGCRKVAASKNSDESHSRQDHASVVWHLLSKN